MDLCLDWMLFSRIFTILVSVKINEPLLRFQGGCQDWIAPLMMDLHEVPKV